MGSFSWNKADKLTQIENISYGCRFKFLIPKEFLRLSNNAQLKFINDFQDNNLINRVKHRKGSLFSADEINLQIS